MTGETIIFNCFITSSQIEIHGNMDLTIPLGTLCHAIIHFPTTNKLPVVHLVFPTSPTSSFNFCLNIKSRKSMCLDACNFKGRELNQSNKYIECKIGNQRQINHSNNSVKT
ncbi:hypothetical protein AAHE18_20G084000 [Arachis hypogaea]